MRWFGLFLLATTVAAAADLGLSAFFEGTGISRAPATRQPITAPEEKTPSAPRIVKLDPARIEVVASRRAVQVEVHANRTSARRQPG